jgi:hypothetical protein
MKTVLKLFFLQCFGRFWSKILQKHLSFILFKTLNLNILVQAKYLSIS